MSDVTTTEPSVEDCLKELREMFPGDCPKIEFSDYRAIGGALVVNVIAGGLALGNNSANRRARIVHSLPTLA